MRRPLLDPGRTELVYLARAARDLTGYRREEMTTTALGFVDLSAVSAPLWNEASEAFECLVIAVEGWDELAARDDEPWDSAVDVAEEVRHIPWDADRWARCQLINIFIDRIIFAGMASHLPLYRVQGDLIVVTEVGP
jgi:hypothetical protein